MSVVDPGCGGWAADVGSGAHRGTTGQRHAGCRRKTLAFNSVTSEVESVAASESSCEPTGDATASFKTSTTNSTWTPTTVCMRRRRPEVSSTFVTLMTRTLVGLVEMRLAIAATKATFSVSVKVSSVYPVSAYVTVRDVCAGGVHAVSAPGTGITRDPRLSLGASRARWTVHTYQTAQAQVVSEPEAFSVPCCCGRSGRTWLHALEDTY